jgi:hypothetical protein
VAAKYGGFGGIVPPRVTDVEELKKKVRKMAAGHVLAGEGAGVRLELAPMKGCRACIAAGYGAPSETPQSVPHDRLMWILDGYVELHTADGKVTDVSQGEATVLAGGVPYRLTFPQLTLYLVVEPAG